jgi:putative transposase
LRRLEVNGDLHPFFGVPRLLHMDNASEFKTVKFQRACVSHHIDLEWRPLGAKHYGGHIERLIGTLMTDYVHFLPGTTYSNTVNRRGYDSEKNSALSFKEFTRWFAGQVAIYHGRKHKGLGCSPASAWKKDFLNSSGEVMHPPIISDPWAFRLDFMPEVIRKVHPQGITLNKKWYWGPSLIPHVGIIRVVVKYDPHSMATVWAKLKGVYIQLHFSDVTESDFSFEERRAVLMLNRKEGVTPDGALDDCSLVDVIEDGEELVKRAVSATKRTRKMLAADFEHKTSSWAGGGVSIKAATGQATNLDKPDYSRQAAPYSRRT